MAHIELNNNPCHYQRIGEGETKVVFIHGLVVDNLSSYYFTLANPVAQMADVLLYDLRGHGKSGMPEKGYALSDFLSDLELVIESQFGREPVVLVGNSFGGTLAIAYAAKYPERVNGLFTIDGLPPLHYWTNKILDGLTLEQKDTDKLFEDLYKDWHGINSTRKTARLWRTSERVVKETSLIEDIRFSHHLSVDQLDAISCPMMALFGSDSDILYHSIALKQHVRDIEVVKVEGCTHAVMFEKTEAVKEQLLTWLANNIIEPGYGSGKYGSEKIA